MIDYSDNLGGLYFSPNSRQREEAERVLELAKKQEREWIHEYVQVDERTVIMKRVRKIK